MDLAYYEEMKQKYIQENKELQRIIDCTIKKESFDSNKLQSLKRLQKDNTQMIIDIDSNMKHLNEVFYTSTITTVTPDIKVSDNGTSHMNESECKQEDSHVKFNTSDPKYKALKEAIEDKRKYIIKLSDVPECLHRTTGKTFAITQLAYEYDLPIITNGMLQDKDRFYDKAKELGFYTDELKFIKYMRGKYYPKCGEILLIDEPINLSPQEISFFMDNFIVIGFIK